MTDIADVAAEGEEAFLTEQLARQQRVAALEVPGSETCCECGGEIPEARRKAMPSATRCIDCQEWTERIARAREEQERMRGR